MLLHLQGMSVCVSTNTITVIAIDRYYRATSAVNFNFNSHLNRNPNSRRSIKINKRSKIQSAFIWFFGIIMGGVPGYYSNLIAIPKMLISGDQNSASAGYASVVDGGEISDDDYHQCIEMWPRYNLKSIYGISFLITQFALPSLSLIASSILINKFLKSHLPTPTPTQLQQRQYNTNHDTFAQPSTSNTGQYAQGLTPTWNRTTEGNQAPEENRDANQTPCQMMDSDIQARKSTENKVIRVDVHDNETTGTSTSRMPNCVIGISDADGIAATGNITNSNVDPNDMITCDPEIARSSRIRVHYEDLSDSVLAEYEPRQRTMPIAGVQAFSSLTTLASQRVRTEGPLGERVQIMTRRNEKVTKTIFLMALSFAVCWLPIFVFNLLIDTNVITNAIPDGYSFDWFAILHVLAMASAPINAIAYGTLNLNITREIQARRGSQSGVGV